MTHERTPTGRAFLRLQRKILGLIERNRVVSAPDDMGVRLMENMLIRLPHTNAETY